MYIRNFHQYCFRVRFLTFYIAQINFLLQRQGYSIFPIFIDIKVAYIKLTNHNLCICCKSTFSLVYEYLYLTLADGQYKPLVASGHLPAEFGGRSVMSSLPPSDLNLAATGRPFTAPVISGQYQQRLAKLWILLQ